MNNNNIKQNLVYQMKSYIKTGIALLFLVSSPSLIADNLTSQELKQLSEDINSVEKKLVNIKIVSEIQIEKKTQADSCEIWEKTPMGVSVTAWFDSPNSKKGRIDVNKETLRWTNGASDYIENNYIMAFDGQSGRRINHSNSFNNKTFKINKGELSSEAPKDLINGSYMTATGRGFTLIFTSPANSGLTWSEFFKMASENEPSLISSFDIEWEEFQGIQCIKVSTEKGSGWGTIYWIDPTRGYSLIGYKSTGLNKDGSERLITSFRVIQLKEVFPGLWWPTEAIEEDASLIPGEPNLRATYRILSVVANDPNFNNSIFSPPFPKDYNVNDKITGKSYVVDSNSN